MMRAASITDRRGAETVASITAEHGGRDPWGEAGRSVTWLSVVLNVGLGVAKIVAGWLGQSRALLADGLHSLTDLATDAAVLVGMFVAAQPADEDHPYGHHKAASLVTLFVAGSLLAFCALLIADSVRALRAGETTVPHWPTLVVALGSIAVKEFLFRRTRRVGQRLNSQLLIANAWHHRTDSLSSVLAAGGIAGAMLLGSSWALLDTLAAVLLAAYLGREGFGLLRQATADLMDAAPGRSVIDDLREHILEDPAALAYHDFRARRVGDMIEVDFHLLVPPNLAVGEAHAVARRVKHAILGRHPEVLSVLVHVEPGLPEHHRDRGVADVRATGLPPRAS
jgi:cation diffusion facilitator family transporter